MGNCIPGRAKPPGLKSAKSRDVIPIRCLIRSFSNTRSIRRRVLDRKPDARLLFASNRDQEIVILYETKGGIRNLEEYPISTIYDFWVKEYVKRKK
jgi:hypothetical protein